MSWREQKRQARRIVHDTMQIAALYYPSRGSVPVPVRVRLQTSFTQIGDDRSAGWAEIEAIKPRLIFMLDELPSDLVLDRNAVVLMLDPTDGTTTSEAYNLDNTLPPDDITVTAEVTRLAARLFSTEGLPAPGSTP